MTDKIGKGLIIFILDDEKDTCHFAKEFFIKRGFEVYTASSGKAAVNTIKKIKPDIALLDIRLAEKEVTGLDVLKSIKEKHPACCCVMVTYMDDEEIIKQAMEMGALDYLKKPLMPLEIEKTIKKIVKKIRKGAKQNG